MTTHAQKGTHPTGPRRKSGHERDDRAVEEFMSQLARFLTAGDAKSISQMWEVPALVLSDGGTHAVGSLSQVEGFFSGAKQQYASRGIEEARPEIQWLDWMTEQLVAVRVRWPYIDKAGKEIGEESSTYTLRKKRDGTLKLQIIVMHGEKKH